MSDAMLRNAPPFASSTLHVPEVGAHTVQCRSKVVAGATGPNFGQPEIAPKTGAKMQTTPRISSYE